MTTEAPATASVVLFKGGASLVDLLVDDPELRITVTGPGMLFERLDLLTTLSPFEGCTVQGFRELAASMEGTIHCGLVGTQRAKIDVVTHRSGGILQIGLGPANMYQSELVLRTRTGETFRALIQRLLSHDPARPFFAGLHAVPATGHLEHHHEAPSGGHHDHASHPEGGGHGRP